MSCSQNESYALFEDSILPLASENYAKSKKIYLERKNHLSYDPSDVALYLTYSLQNNDVTFFKSEICKLFKHFGYYYSYSDTTGISMINTLNQEIVSHDMAHWMVKKSNKYFPKWISKNPNYFQLQKTLEAIHTSDQLVRRIGISSKDSSCVSTWKNSYDSVLASIDLKNIIQLQTLCIQNNFTLPNNYENGYSTYNQIMFIVFHNLKQGTNINATWQRLGAYIEQAYLDGKISSNFFYTYDYYLNIYQGMQYYGTLGADIPNRDPAGYNDRQKKFNL